MLKSILLLVAMSFLSGCASLEGGGFSSKIPVQYATLKAIDSSSNITPAGVLEHTQKVREILEININVSIDDLLSDAVERVALDKLDPADRLLVNMLFYQIETAAGDIQFEASADDRVVRILTLLDWIDEAARLAL